MANKRAAATKKTRQDRYSDEDRRVVPIERARDKKRKSGDDATLPPGTLRKRVEFLKEAQGHYYHSFNTHVITFGIGPAGTGKTHVAVGKACEMLMAKQIQQIVITRPVQGVGEDIGFLPGELEEKFDPYFAPVRVIMESFLGKSHLENLIKNEKVIVMPLQFIRGRTFDSAFMILDEAQNTTVEQMKAFLTRIGRYSTVAVNGDVEQIDIKEPSGLVDALARFGKNAKFGTVEFDLDDIVREDIVRDVLLGYRQKL